MDVAEREDTLLSLMRQARLTGQGGKPADIACHTCLSDERVQKILTELKESGEVTYQDDGTYHLSPSGIQAAETIMRRPTRRSEPSASRRSPMHRSTRSAEGSTSSP